MRNLSVRSAEALDKAPPDAFPWLEVLPAEDRQVFVNEFARVVVAPSVLYNYLPLIQLIGSGEG